MQRSVLIVQQHQEYKAFLLLFKVNFVLNYAIAKKEDPNNHRNFFSTWFQFIPCTREESKLSLWSRKTKKKQVWASPSSPVIRAVTLSGKTCQPPAPQIVGEFTWITPGKNGGVQQSLTRGLIYGGSPATEHPKARSWVWKPPERGPCDRDRHSLPRFPGR